MICWSYLVSSESVIIGENRGASEEQGGLCKESTRTVLSSVACAAIGNCLACILMEESF